MNDHAIYLAFYSFFYTLRGKYPKSLCPVFSYFLDLLKACLTAVSRLQQDTFPCLKKDSLKLNVAPESPPRARQLKNIIFCVLSKPSKVGWFYA